MQFVTEEQAKELVKLVRHKVWSYTRGRAGPDTEDAVQEVVTRVLEQLPRFDATRASLRTFQSRLIERAYVSYLRHLRAAKRGNGRTRHMQSSFGRSFVDRVDSAQHLRAQGKRVRSQIELSDLSLDLETATAGLDPQQQRLCTRIKHKPVAEIAQEDGVARGTIYRRLRPIRQLLEDARLAEYLD